MSASAPPGKTASHRRTLVDEAEQALRAWLAPGHLRNGDRLPPEHDLAAQLGVSRGTLRTALERLSATGEVVRRQGSGTFVGDIAELRSFSEGLERLTPYSRLARARGIELRGIDVAVSMVPLEADTAVAFEVEPGDQALFCSRVLLANGTRTAYMQDVVNPSIELPAEDELRRQLQRGRMMLDVLAEGGVPLAYSHTRIRAHAIGPHEECGQALAVEGATAVLELKETIHDRRGVAVLRSSDLFAPGGIDLHINRHLEVELPEPVARLTD